MNNVVKAIQDKDDKKAYALFKEVRARSAASDEYFWWNFGAIEYKKFICKDKGICFMLRPSEMGWRRETTKSTPNHACLVYDDKPIVVRQCLAALHEVVLYRSELREAIKAELGAIDFSRHKESMSPLIKKDVEELLNLIDW